MPSSNHGQTLLSIARASIVCAMDGSRAADEGAPWLHDRGACFVTLTQQGDLRGCIGTLEARRSLLADVRANAIAAAFHDPRFPPLVERELNRTEIEVSLLSPMHALSFSSEAEALAQLRPEVDGVVFEFGARRSTFLPQVWEHLPTPDAFMAHLKRKAGLPGEFWSEDVRLLRYTVSKWKESDQKRDNPIHPKTQTT
jgi:AmmeMemoRadiSam system protein A